MIGTANGEVVLTLMTIDSRVAAVEYNAAAITTMEALRAALSACSEAFVEGTEELLTESEYALRRKQARGGRVQAEWARRIRVIPDEEPTQAEVTREARARARAVVDTVARQLGVLGEEPPAEGMPEELAGHLRNNASSIWL